MKTPLLLEMGLASGERIIDFHLILLMIECWTWLGEIKIGDIQTRIVLLDSLTEGECRQQRFVAIDDGASFLTKKKRRGKS
jgi:hypothetical protein